MRRRPLCYKYARTITDNLSTTRRKCPRPLLSPLHHYVDAVSNNYICWCRMMHASRHLHMSASYGLCKSKVPVGFLFISRSWKVETGEDTYFLRKPDFPRSTRFQNNFPGQKNTSMSIWNRKPIQYTFHYISSWNISYLKYQWAKQNVGRDTCWCIIWRRDAKYGNIPLSFCNLALRKMMPSHANAASFLAIHVFQITEYCVLQWDCVFFKFVKASDAFAS